MGKSRDDYRGLLQAVSEIDKARMAAFIDGEGSIFIGGGKSRPRGGMVTPQFRLQLIISNTNYALMNWLKSTFDGSVYFVKYEKSKHLGTKQIMRWQVNERMAKLLLEAVLPYMIVKKPQAELAIAFMATKRDRPRQFFPNAISPEEFNLRQSMSDEMRRLNKSDGREIIN